MQAKERGGLRYLFRSPHLSGSHKGHLSCNVQYSCCPVGCHLRRKVVKFAVSHETHNPKVGGSNPPPATKPFIELRASDVFTAGAKKGNKQASAVKCDKRSCFGSLFILPLSPL